jgi:hypothetical protein
MADESADVRPLQPLPTLAVAPAYEACIQLSNGLHIVMRANCGFTFGANPPHFSLHC